MQKLINIQNKLKAPKSQENKFGGYKYRSCEDIMEAVKPLLKEEKCALVVKDDVIYLGETVKDAQCRFYIKATATLYDETGKEIASSSAFAREPLNKKGSDESQITGAASSYARKYALNGLFCIDDTKDADTMDNRTDNTQKIKAMKERIGAMLDKIDPAVDTSMFAKYKELDDVDALTQIGIAVKKLFDTQGA